MTLQFRRQDDQGSGEDTDHHDLQMEGSSDQISQTLDVLAWIIAIFRRPMQDHLTVSEIDFAYKGGPKERPDFELSLLPLNSSFPIRADGPGQCWTSMFPRSILAYGFPVPSKRRPDGMLGLEIPFEILTTFAGIRFPLKIGQGLILAGPSTLLVPCKKVDNAIQWHYLSGKDRFEHLRELNKAMGLSFQGENWADLAQPTAFLGHCKYAVIRLGTQGLDASPITPSQVPSIGPTFEVNHAGTGSFGFNKYVTAQANFDWKISSREKAAIPGADIQLSDRLARGRDTPLLLYDNGACRAWLVSELSVALHMTHVYLSGKNLDGSMKDRIPVAAAASNGGEAAFQAIETAAELSVPLRFGCQREFPKIVDDFLTVFEQRKQQEIISRTVTRISLKDGLRGWDFDQLQRRPLLVEQQKLSRGLMGQRSPVWWKLFKSPEVLVIFGRDIGCPIQPSPEGPEPFCTSWNDVPLGHHLLIASVPSLLDLQRMTCTHAQGLKEQYMLSNKVGWARPSGSRLFEPCVQGGLCTPLQGMQVVGKGPLWKPGSVWRTLLPPPAELVQDGAVIFADRPEKVERRPCQISLPVPPM